MSRLVGAKRHDDDASARLDNLRYVMRLIFIVPGRRNRYGGFLRKINLEETKEAK